MKPEQSTLLDSALYDPDPIGRDQARGKLAREVDPTLLKTLVGLLDAHHRQTRRRTIRILSEIHPQKSRPALVKALVDPEQTDRVRVGVARVLTVLSSGDEAALAIGLKDASPRVRRACATSAAPRDALIAALDDSDPAVLERVAEALTGEVPVERVRAACARCAEPPTTLVRLLARVDPTAEVLLRRAHEGDPVALDHVTDRPTLSALLTGSHRLAAAWGLARTGEVPFALATDPDPRIRAAAARLGAPLQADPDPGVAWLARRAAEGAFSPEALDRRMGRHDRLDAPSAQPPYGLRPDDPVPQVARAEAAIAMCHTRFDVNLGVVIRSAEAAGLREAFVVGRHDLFRSPARGTDLLVPVRHAPDAAALIRMAREGGYQIVALQQTPDSVPYHQADYPPRPLFVVGAENSGVPPALRRAADLIVEIPQYGVIDSLNVAAAATCVMFMWRALRSN